jgi:RNA recognition motif-containing protein
MTDSELHEVFSAHGSVERAEVVMDRDTGRSRGFGFVEMSSDSDAEAAIQALNGTEADGRALTVNEARPKVDSRGGGRGYGNRVYGGGGDR